MVRNSKGIVQAVAADRQVVCHHCGNTTFRSRRVLLNSGKAEFFGFSAFSEEAIALACVVCGFMLEFADGSVALRDAEG